MLATKAYTCKNLEMTKILIKPKILKEIKYSITAEYRNDEDASKLKIINRNKVLNYCRYDYRIDEI